MKLSDASIMTVVEARYFMDTPTPIVEDGEGPRWKFRYDRWKVDPTPDILLLGAWRHPNTGNNLVGGVNLHYLDKRQIDQLARALPKIMGAGNLKTRYWTGKQLAPEVFTKYYRTYNADFIRGAEKDVLYPKYGFLKTAQNWLKKKLGGIFKSKAQRDQEAQPQYPSDLSDMQSTLDKVVTDLQKQPQQAAVAKPGQKPEVVPPETPEMRRAREAFQQYQREKTLKQLGLQDTEDNILQHSYDDYIDSATGAEPPAQAPPAATAPQPQQQPLRPDPRKARQELQQDRQENQEELNNPNNDVDLESIAYYSPVTGHMMVESISLSRLRSTLTEAPSRLLEALLLLRPKLAMAAQVVYNEWDQNTEAMTDEVFGGGGICDSIANAMWGILSDNGIDCTEGGHDGDDHAYLIAYDAVDTFSVDIPPAIYEEGMGFSWVKIPGVEFEPTDVVILKTWRPDWIDDTDAQG